MAFNLAELMAIFPHQLWLEISEQSQADCWRLAQQDSTKCDRWTTYLNALCVDRFLAWLQAEFDPHEVQLQAESDRSVGNGINGTRLSVGDTRMVLIPDDKSSVSEFCIPQAWVDTPAWAADYYLAVQLNLEAGWLRVWGYATGTQVRQANYDRISRTYCLAAEDLIEDLNVLWVTQAMRSLQKPIVQGSLNQAEPLFKQLNYPTVDSSSLEQAALLSSDERSSTEKI